MVTNTPTLIEVQQNQKPQTVNRELRTANCELTR